jgi:hypothetical protein
MKLCKRVPRASCITSLAQPVSHLEMNTGLHGLGSLAQEKPCPLPTNSY